MDSHLKEHYAFYGDYLGVRTARKHIGWYVQDLVDGEEFRQQMNLLTSCDEQLAAVSHFLIVWLGNGYNTAPLKKKWPPKANVVTA